MNVFIFSDALAACRDFFFIFSFFGIANCGIAGQVLAVTFTGSRAGETGPARFAAAAGAWEGGLSAPQGASFVVPSVRTDAFW